MSSTVDQILLISSAVLVLASVSACMVAWQTYNDCQRKRRRKQRLEELRCQRSQ